jgi:hypothetical protein
MYTSLIIPTYPRNGLPAGDTDMEVDLLEGADELDLAQGEVSDGAHHASHAVKQVHAGVLARYPGVRNITYLHHGWHLKYQYVYDFNIDGPVP